MAFTYTKLADFILNQIFGLQSANSIKNSVRYLGEDILGDPSTNSNKVNFSAITQAAANASFDTYTRTTGTTVGVRGIGISASSGNYTNSVTGTFTNTTNLDVTITTVGRPVLLCLIDDGSTNGSHINGSGTLTFAFVRGSTLLGYHSYASGTILPPGVATTVDVVTSGTYTYHFATMPLSPAQTTTVKYCKLMAMEL